MPSDFSKKRVAVLGAGKMGGILLKALLEKQLFSSKTTVATVQHEEKARTLSKKLGIPVTTDNRPPHATQTSFWSASSRKLSTKSSNKSAPVLPRTRSSSQWLLRFRPAGLSEF